MHCEETLFGLILNLAVCVIAYKWLNIYYNVCSFVIPGDEFEYIGGKEKHNIFKWQGFSTEAFFDRDDPHAFADIKSSFRSGEPDNTNGNEQCVCVKQDGLWNDCKCSARRYFICEKR